MYILCVREWILQDGAVPPSMSRLHFNCLRNRGVDTNYLELDCGHVDFNLFAKDEIIPCLLRALRAREQSEA